ncbi:hypothetical protein [Peribacillus butanolivorans]
MKKLTIKLDNKTFKMLEEITKHYNEEDGLNCSIEETVEQLITSHFFVEIKLKK